MNIYESAEDYLEQILMLLEKKGHARSIDIAVGLNVSKPSVSVAMKKLRENGYISMSSDNLISLTDEGWKMFEILRRDREGESERVFAGLSADELLLAEKIFQTVSSNLENMT